MHDDKSLTYQFSESGNVTCVLDELGFASFTQFDNNIGAANTPSQGRSPRKAIINKFQDMDFTGAIWINAIAGNTASRYAATTCLGLPSEKLTNTADNAPWRPLTRHSSGAARTPSRRV